MSAQRVESMVACEFQPQLRFELRYKRRHGLIAHSKEQGAATYTQVFRKRTALWNIVMRPKNAED